MIIDEARTNDLASLVELEQLCSPHPWSEPTLAAALSGTAGDQVIIGRAEDELTELLGFCVFRALAEEVEIHNIAVRPQHRRQGLARALLVRALELAAASGARVAHLEVRAGNAAAVALYRHLGFSCVGRRANYYASPEEDALLFSAAVQRPPIPPGGARRPGRGPGR